MREPGPGPASALDGSAAAGRVGPNPAQPTWTAQTGQASPKRANPKASLGPTLRRGRLDARGLYASVIATAVATQRRCVRAGPGEHRENPQRARRRRDRDSNPPQSPGFRTRSPRKSRFRYLPVPHKPPVSLGLATALVYKYNKTWIPHHYLRVGVQRTVQATDARGSSAVQCPSPKLAP